VCILQESKNPLRVKGKKGSLFLRLCLSRSLSVWFPAIQTTTILISYILNSCGFLIFLIPTFCPFLRFFLFLYFSFLYSKRGLINVQLNAKRWSFSHLSSSEYAVHVNGVYTGYTVCTYGRNKIHIFMQVKFRKSNILSTKHYKLISLIVKETKCVIIYSCYQLIILMLRDKLQFTNN
jgi:hypothetical protein